MQSRSPLVLFGCHCDVGAKASRWLSNERNRPSLLVCALTYSSHALLGLSVGSLSLDSYHVRESEIDTARFSHAHWQV